MKNSVDGNRTILYLKKYTVVADSQPVLGREVGKPLDVAGEVILKSPQLRHHPSIFTLRKCFQVFDGSRLESECIAHATRAVSGSAAPSPDTSSSPEMSLERVMNSKTVVTAKRASYTASGLFGGFSTSDSSLHLSFKPTEKGTVERAKSWIRTGFLSIN